MFHILHGDMHCTCTKIETCCYHDNIVIYTLLCLYIAVDVHVHVHVHVSIFRPGVLAAFKQLLLEGDEIWERYKPTASYSELVLGRHSTYHTSRDMLQGCWRRREREEEEDFPRGGQGVLLALEKREIRDQAMNEHTLFREVSESR